MGQKVMKVIAATAQIPDQPGTMAQMMAMARDRGLAIKAICAWPSGEGMTTVVGIPEHIEEARKMAAEDGKPFEESAMVWLEGADETGALCDFLDKVAAAGINVSTIVAVGAGGSFGAAIGFADEATVDRVVALMGG